MNPRPAMRAANDSARSIDVVHCADHFVGRFMAMACPCEVLVETLHASVAWRAIGIAAECAWRIEQKFSRYRDDNIIHRINAAGGKPVAVDDETARLLDFAAALTQISEGRFDVTSGILRQAWTFDRSDRIPEQSAIDALLPRIGWSKVRWSRPDLQMPPGMQLDFGGIGKEYAVDTAAELIEAELDDVSCVVNFGGDVAVRHARTDGAPWRIGIEAAAAPGAMRGLVALRQGGLATSGDSHRFILRHGKRYSHILDARTGWPVADAPRSVTVAAGSCTQAGALSTLAILQGATARAFLECQNLQFWLQ